MLTGLSNRISPDPAVLNAQGLAYDYGNGRGIYDLTLSLASGEVLGLLGVNGAGKSTALRLLAGQLLAQRGRLIWRGQRWRGGAHSIAGDIGFLSDPPPLYAEVRVSQQLRYCARLHGLRGQTLEERLQWAARRCELDDLWHRRVGRLSRGQMQRVGIAQAVLHRPRLLLLDEPTAGLDPLQAQQLLHLIEELRPHSAVILSSHLLGEVESACSRIMMLHEGRPVFSSSLPLRETATEVDLTLRRPPPVAALQALPWVVWAEPVEGGFRVELNDPGQALEALAGHAVEHHWGLIGLRTRRTSLESLFNDLTRGRLTPS